MMGMEFYETDDKVVSISSSIGDKIKRLKTHRADNSGYTPGGLMLQWRLVDNLHICKTEDELKALYMPMQFITMVGVITDEFKNKYKVEYHHEALLRRLYIDLDSDDEGILITTGFKRPFGNSNVDGDVAEEMKDTYVLYGKKEYYPYVLKDGVEIGDKYIEEYDNLIEGLIKKEYFKFIDILEAYMREFIMEYTIFSGLPKVSGSGYYRKPEDIFDWGKYLHYFGRHRLHSYMENWQLSNIELRAEKIDKLIS